jgi:phenylalanine-4-hydroxylase
MKPLRFFQVEDKTGLQFTLLDRPGVLNDALKIFALNNVNLSYISSKPSKFKNGDNLNVDFFVDLEGKSSDPRIIKAIEELKTVTKSLKYSKIDEVPWFPKNIQDLNQLGRVLLSAGEQLTSDHPGFNDEEYRKRRDEITQISNSYQMEQDENIPDVKYTVEETKLWSFMWDQLVPLHKKYACKEFNENFEAFIKEAGFTREEIPQLSKITKFLKKETGTIYRPVAGLLSQREFLNGLAFRVFHSTQYIRHRSEPLYTPEPDIIHEILGHAIMFANKDFADFSQAIGLASLGVSDEDVTRLGNIYWFTIEFGICSQNNKKKIYGSGILSSPKEIEWVMSDKPRINPFDLYKMATIPYSITDLQVDYFLAPSFAEMKQKVLKYSENIKRPFNITYDSNTKEVIIDRKIITRDENEPASKESLI